MFTAFRRSCVSEQALERQVYTQNMTHLLEAQLAASADHCSLGMQAKPDLSPTPHSEAVPGYDRRASAQPTRQRI
jgi:hypothetical protein